MPDSLDELIDDDAVATEWEALEEAVKAATPAKGSSQVQSLIFPKLKKWTAAKAKAWAKRHGMRSDKVDETSTSFRLRQKSPGTFKKFRTICLSPGRDTPQGQCRVAGVLGIKEADELPPGVEIITHDVAEKALSMSSNELSEALTIGMTPEMVIELLGEPDGRSKYVSHYPDGDSYESETLAYGKGLRVDFTRDALTGWSLQEGSLLHKSLDVKFAALDDDKHLVFGIVMEPDVVDTQGDITSSDEIEKAAHLFMEHSRVMGDSHKKAAKAAPVESYIAPVDFELGGQKVTEGSWVMASKVYDDEMWEAVKAGEFTGFSIGAYTRRVPIEPADGAGDAD